MNPNIDRFPVPNTAPAGMSAQPVEFGMPVPAAERAPLPEASRASQPQPVFSVPAAVNGVPTTPQAALNAPAVNVNAAVSPISDLDPEFEKKWVNVAKGIVERTKGDPHLQSRELGRAGEEYRKRLGRRVDPSKE